MDQLIDASHFKSFNKLYPLIHQHYPDMSKSEIMEVIGKRLHDRHLKLRHKRPYMNRIFDPVIGCYFHDLLQQTEDRPKGYPHYFHIFIESNSRYAFAYPIEKKTAETAIETLNRFINDNNGKPVRKLTSDGEGAFKSERFLNYCSVNGIAVKIINDKAHSSLGLVDRFIRTLRDMNQPQNRNPGYQYDNVWANFSINDMAHLINVYNHTFHKTIGCSPFQMYSDEALEREWIYKQQRFKTIQKNIEDFNIPLQSWVRIRLNNNDLGGRKRRGQFSREKYLVVNKVGNRYVLQGEGRGVITKSRFELIPAEGNEPTGPEFNYEQTVIPNEITIKNF